ncbi:unnamed protein product [Moneuplotes crassus]|uniref:Uncharacterized protein n=1 Tax=Euplotes crassus TaxID=5936 RepID=A0AAD1X9K1_EUPCR|nr:unnamed protein product [Moneuplotes crassus]
MEFREERNLGTIYSRKIKHIFQRGYFKNQSKRATSNNFARGRGNDLPSSRRQHTTIKISNSFAKSYISKKNIKDIKSKLNANHRRTSRGLTDLRYQSVGRTQKKAYPPDQQHNEYRSSMIKKFTDKRTHISSNFQNPTPPPKKRRIKMTLAGMNNLSLEKIHPKLGLESSCGSSDPLSANKGYELGSVIGSVVREKIERSKNCLLESKKILDDLEKSTLSEKMSVSPIGMGYNILKPQKSLKNPSNFRPPNIPQSHQNPLPNFSISKNLQKPHSKLITPIAEHKALLSKLGRDSGRERSRPLIILGYKETSLFSVPAETRESHDF